MQRSSPIGHIKKAYRTLSLELHPDKNKAATANEDFAKINNAFNVLTDREKKREYDRLGEHGVKVASHSVIDHKYLVLQIVIYYSSSLAFSFLLNLSEKGEAFEAALLGLAGTILYFTFHTKYHHYLCLYLAMLLVELLLVVHEVQLPGWFFPSMTPHEIVTTLHQVYAPFMHGCRCILAVLNVDRKAQREQVLETLIRATTDVSMRMENICNKVQEALALQQIHDDDDDDDDGSSDSVPSNSNAESMQELINKSVQRAPKSKDSTTDVANRLKAAKEVVYKNQGREKTFEFLRNLLLYLVARFIYFRTAAN